MGRLAIGLAVAAARASWRRTMLIVMTIAVAAATCLWAAGIPRALDLQDERVLRRESPAAAPSATDAAVLWWAPRGNTQWIPRVGRVHSVAVAGSGGAPLPIGAPVIPQPGEMVVSPALERALDDLRSPARGWLPNRVVGTLDRAALHDPDELVAYLGWDEASLRATGRAVALTTTTPIADTGRVAPKAANATPVAMLSAAIALALLIPIMGLLRVALLADSAARQRRIEAIGVVGATVPELRRLAAVEGASYGVAGIGLAFVAKRLVEAVVPSVRFGSQALFSADIAPAPGVSGALAVACLLAAMAATAFVLVPRRAEPRRRNGAPARAAVVVAAGLGALWIAGRAARDDASIASRLVLGSALVLVAIGAAGLVTSILRGAAQLGRNRGGPEALLARRGLLTDTVAAARGLGSLALAVAVVALATVAYGSLAATSADRQHASAWLGSVLEPDASIYGLHGESEVEELVSIPGVRTVLPLTFGPTGRVVHGECADLAAAVDVDGPAACGGSRASLYVRPGHALNRAPGTVELPMLANVFPPIDVLSSVGEPPPEATEVFLDLNDDSDATLAAVGATALQLSPTAYVISGTGADDGSQPGLAEDLDRSALAATAMVVIAVVTAVVAGAERLMSRRAVLAHLSVVGLTSRQARRAAAAEFGLGLLTALATGVVCGLGAGYALVSGLAIDVAPAWARLGRSIVVVVAVGVTGVVLVQRRMTRSFDPAALRIE